MASEAPGPVLDRVRGAFRAIAEAVLPPDAELGADGWERAFEIIEASLADRPTAVKRQLQLFVRGVNLLSVPIKGRTLRRLSREQRVPILERLERSRILLVRRGFWGVRTLALMGYYGQQEVRDRIGYRALPGGWAARRGAAQSQSDATPEAEPYGPPPESQT